MIDFAAASEMTTLCLSALFFGILFMVIIQNRFSMFFKLRHGRTHALTGLVHLCLLTASFLEAFFFHAHVLHQLLLDCLVGGCGIFLAYSAALDFNHKHVKNSASGTLDAHATVTHDEMLEHVFYQIINLAQILYLHSMGPELALWKRLAMALAVSSVWLVRDRFPVHAFSANYEKQDPRSSDHVRWLYRLKKLQYVFYKHFLLHGLNVSVALSGEALASARPFRVYWLLLNTSYVMEFFLQTLVKKGFLAQSRLLAVQRLLMLASSLAALHALRHVQLPVAAASLGLNFAHRHHEVQNCCLLLLGAAACHHLWGHTPPNVI